MPLSSLKQQSKERICPQNTTSSSRNQKMISKTPASTTQEQRLMMMETLSLSQCLDILADKSIFLSPTSQDLTLEVLRSKIFGLMVTLPREQKLQLGTLLGTLSQRHRFCQKLTVLQVLLEILMISRIIIRQATPEKAKNKPTSPKQSLLNQKCFHSAPGKDLIMM
jgi:hypothetical protein